MGEWYSGLLPYPLLLPSQVLILAGQAWIARDFARGRGVFVVRRPAAGRALGTVHTPAGIARAADAFRGLIDRALAHGGSYFLTYHRWATRAQVERCHPRFAAFLRAKRRYDPEERFQSDWYRQYRAMFADALSGATPAGGTIEATARASRRSGGR
jgi:hypothetical protein